jgi:hypothetical protein
MCEASVGNIDDDLFYEIKDLLSANDYIAKVSSTEEDICLLELPKTKNKQEISYNIQRESPSGITITINNNQEFWSCPEYALRLMVLCDILRRMRKIPVNEGLISYYDKDNQEVEEISDIIPEPTNEEDRIKEGFLNTLIRQAIEDKFPSVLEDVAESHHVSTGYRLLKSFF